MAGYSGTPLVKKLGIKQGFRIALVNAPKRFEKEIEPFPPDAKILVSPLPKHIDLIVLFVDSQRSLRQQFSKFARKLTPNGTLWIAWPKKASGVITDLSENSVREIGLEAGLVDVKVCAVNDIWSGLKFVYRLQDRKVH
jgi:hypothetical protein